MKTRFVTVTIGIVTLVALSVALFHHAAQRANPAANTSLRIGTTPNLLLAPFMIADDQKLWAKFGIAPVKAEYFNGRAAVDGLLGGQVDVATVAETPLALMGSQSHRVSIVATFVTSSSHMQLIVRKDHHIQTPADLRGRLVALAKGTAQEYFFDRYLTLNKIDPAEVHVVNLAPPDAVAPFVHGDVDAAVTWEPLLSAMFEKAGTNATVFPTAGTHTMTFNVVARPDFIAAHEDQIENLLRTLESADEFISAHRDASVSIVAQQLKLPSSKVEHFWDAYHFQLSLSTQLLDELNRQARWATQAGLASPASPSPNFSQMINTRPLRQVAPQAVSIDLRKNSGTEAR